MIDTLTGHLPIAFAGSGLDRADALRANPERLAALRDGRARALVLDGLEPALDDAGALVWADLDARGVMWRRAMSPRQTRGCGKRWRTWRMRIWRPMALRAV